ncbi:D-alanine--D-alanine ligase [Aestuariispira insulae]|uniref:D-alanine--D-alanine ligase n=1 Tax=Aestuariispira insulae TaxID=1461337 RepID=A0A3D9HX95_9PROT|nr:D-alanine--D-alanine ligase [Aestuariispira insulae]RED54117.1 D-alanine-D-alanine ligase [Aestuariispira insulae]
MTKHVAVILGGWSEEREVSLVSGEACAKGLEEKGYEVTRIDLTRDLKETLEALDPKPDVVFNALHGRYGEDGTIQAVLDLLQIPYTHSGLLASAVAMDKPMALRLFRAAGIPTAEGMIVKPEDLGRGDPMPRPYVVKPAREGSSVGVYIVQEGDNGPDYSSWTLGDALVEEFIPGLELTTAVMGDKALAVTELRPLEGFYSYEAKYTDGKTTHLCPAPIPDDVAKRCQDYALRAHRILGCRGVSRADFRYDAAKDRLIILEVNTQPGMTPLSLVPEQAAYKGISFPDLMKWMVENAQCDG